MEEERELEPYEKHGRPGKLIEVEADEVLGVLWEMEDAEIDEAVDEALEMADLYAAAEEMELPEPDENTIWH